jgi:hypothetical protein
VARQRRDREGRHPRAGGGHPPRLQHVRRELLAAGRHLDRDAERCACRLAPGLGIPYGRADGWGLTVCASYSLGDTEWRRLVRPWFNLVIDLVRDGQMDCTGIIQATFMGNIFGAQYRNRQSIEAAITEHALVGMRESVFRGDEDARVGETNEVLKKAFYAMISPLVQERS